MAVDHDVARRVVDDEWTLWARVVLFLAALLLAVGGFVGAVYAKDGQSLLLGLVAAVAGALLLAQVPGDSADG